MPRTGKPFSVEMTNCGALGWVSDKDGGYRYQATHPVTGGQWPRLPDSLLEIWRTLADFGAPPEACLVNLYAAGTKLGSHVDADEAETRAPVLSVSLGCDAVFHVGGLEHREHQVADDAAVRGRRDPRREGTARLPRHRPDRAGYIRSRAVGRADQPDAAAGDGG